MSNERTEILKTFLKDSLQVTQECLKHLQDLEGHPNRAQEILIIGNKIDRVMGAARMLAPPSPPESALGLIGDAAYCCKKVAKQGARSAPYPVLFMKTLEFLKDGIHTVDQLLNFIGKPLEQIPAASRRSLFGAMDELLALGRETEGRLEDDETLTQVEVDKLLKKRT